MNPTHIAINPYNSIKQSFMYTPFYLAFIALFLSFAFLFKGKGRLIFLISSNTAISILLFIDILYFRGTSNMPSIIIAEQGANLDGMLTCVLSMMNFIDILFFMDILVVIIAVVAIKDIKYDFIRKIPIFFILFGLSLCVVLYIPIKVNFLGLADGSIQCFNMIHPTFTSERLSPVGYHLVDAYLFLTRSQHYSLSDSEKKDINEWFVQKNESIKDNEYQSIFKGKNLIFIQVESLEGFVIDKKINNQEITPNINKLLSNSLYFTNVCEQVGEGTTSDADLMSTTSVYPIKSGSTFLKGII